MNPLVTLFVFLMMAIVPVSAAAPVINGFFIQPSLGYGGIDYDGTKFSTQEHFDQWIQSMADVGAEMLFYQWTTHFWGNQSWYSEAYGTPTRAAYAYYDIASTSINSIATQSWTAPTSWPGADVPAIDKALVASEKAGVKLWLGLYLNEDSESFNWWDAVSNSTITAEDSAIIQHHIDMSLFLVDDLYAKYGNHPAFGGFYYPVEIANLAFYHEENWDELTLVLRDVAQRVHDKDPNLAIAISPFFNTAGSLGGNGLASPKEYGAMWEYVLAYADLDVLILQDGVGVDPHILTDSEDLVTPYFKAVQEACYDNNVAFWANSELATNNGTRLNPQFYSSNIKKVSRQLATENPLAEKNVSFSFQYMDPNPLHTFAKGTYMADEKDGPAERLRLYTEYRHYLDTLSQAVGTEKTLETKGASPFSLSFSSGEIRFVAGVSEQVSFAVYTVLGRVVQQGVLRGGESLSLSSLRRGVYYFRATTGSYSFEQSVVLP